MSTTWELVISKGIMGQLTDHLFPGDGDEHGAVIGATLHETTRGIRLLVRHLALARDGVDYVPGERGYRMLRASFVTDQILSCAAVRLVYLAVHCHGGANAVSFSGDDLASHERGYPALLDIANGLPVGGLVFARNAVAGDIWLPGGQRLTLTRARVVGRPIHFLYPAPPQLPESDPAYDRQARIFGDRGQTLLAGLKVGVLGAGGAGSLIVEYLSRLGIGHLVVIDPERIEASNLPRVVGSRRRDVHPWLTSKNRPRWLRAIGLRVATHKVTISRRVARQANPQILIEPVVGNVIDDAVATRLVDCDYLFLAADSMQARLVFNAIIHQYLVPGVQVGAKVQVDSKCGEILDVFSIIRPITPDLGCLWCNGLVSPARLQEEALPAVERGRQRYVDDDNVVAPSVITLNAVAAAHAANDFLFTMTGILDADAAHRWLRILPAQAEFEHQLPRQDPACPECGPGDQSRLATGPARRLPTRG